MKGYTEYLILTLVILVSLAVILNFAFLLNIQSRMISLEKKFSSLKLQQGQQAQNEQIIETQEYTEPAIYVFGSEHCGVTQYTVEHIRETFPKEDIYFINVATQTLSTDFLNKLQKQKIKVIGDEQYNALLMYCMQNNLQTAKALPTFVIVEKDIEKTLPTEITVLPGIPSVDNAGGGVDFKSLNMKGIIVSDDIQKTSAVKGKFVQELIKAIHQGKPAEKQFFDNYCKQ